MFRYAFLCLAFWVSLGAIAKQVTITIVATTDTHSNVTSYDYLVEEDLNYGFLQGKTLLDNLKVQSSDMILVDCGDTLAATPLTDCYFKNPDEENVPAITAMGMMGYDVAVPGNHDFDYGIGFLENAIRQSEVKWIASNIKKEDGQPYLQETAIVLRSGVRVGFFGLTTPVTAIYNDPAALNGVVFEDMVESAEKAVKILQAQGADLIVGLVHSGLGQPNMYEKMDENACYEIASKVPGIHLMFMGHTHEEVPYKMVNNVVLCQPGDSVKSLGVAIVSLQQRDEKWEILSRSSTTVSTLNLDKDKKMWKAVKYSDKPVEDFLDEKIGYYEDRLDFTTDPLAPGNAVLFVHSIMKEFGNPDVTCFPIQNPDTVIIRKKGSFRRKYLYEISPYNDTLVKMTIKGSDLDRIIEHMASKLTSDGEVRDGVNIDECDHFDGVDSRFNLSAPYGERVTVVSVNGKPFNADELYTIVTTSYRAGGGGGYFSGLTAESLEYAPERLHTLIEKRFKTEEEKDEEEKADKKVDEDNSKNFDYF